MSFKEWWNDDRTFDECHAELIEAWSTFIKELAEALSINKLLCWLENKLSNLNK